MEGQVKCFPDKVKQKEFIITKPLLHEMLKGLIYKKEDQYKGPMDKHNVGENLPGRRDWAGQGRVMGKKLGQLYLNYNKKFKK